MLISFIIAYHNEPHAMLRECIQSICRLRLSSDDHEILVINDGSKASPKAMLEAEFPNVICIDTCNRGLSEARNYGLQLAKGTYIQFVDSDDSLIPESYRQLLTMMTQDNLDMLMFRYSFKKETSNTSIPQDLRINSGTDFLCHNNLRAAACAYVFRHETLGDLRFYPGIYHEDVLFTPQLILKAKRIAAVKTEAYFYRQHEGTIMNSKSTSHISKRISDLRFILQSLKERNVLAGQEAEAMKRVVAQQTMVYLYIVATTQRSLKVLRQEASSLRSAHLMPLPLKAYSPRYFLFAIASRIV